LALPEQLTRARPTAERRATVRRLARPLGPRQAVRASQGSGRRFPAGRGACPGPLDPVGGRPMASRGTARLRGLGLDDGCLMPWVLSEVGIERESGSRRPPLAVDLLEPGAIELDGRGPLSALPAGQGRAAARRSAKQPTDLAALGLGGGGAVMTPSGCSAIGICGWPAPPAPWPVAGAACVGLVICRFFVFEHGHLRRVCGFPSEASARVTAPSDTPPGL